MVSLEAVVLLFLVPFCLGDYFSEAAVEYPHIQGWYDGRRVFYYNFFGNSPTTPDGSSVTPCPLYSLVFGFTNGNASEPIPVTGQHNIAPSLPGDGTGVYSDLWQIVFLQVPKNYVANTVMDSLVAVNSFPNQTMGPLLNCPVVPVGSTLVGNEIPVSLGWYKNKTINYYNFGPNEKFTIPIYIVANSPDQHNIINAIPPQSGYSAFWLKELFTAPSGYIADTDRDVTSISTLGSPAVNGSVVNCPVIMVETDVYPTSTETQTEASMGEGSQLMANLFASLIAIYLVLVK